MLPYFPHVVGQSPFTVLQMFSETIYAPSRAQTLLAFSAHAHSVYNAYPNMLSIVSETSYEIWVGFIKSDKVLTIIFYLLTSEVKKSVLVQLINYQLFDLLLSLGLNSHFTPYLLICALGALTISNLAYTAHFLECQHPKLFDQYENFFLFINFFFFPLGFKVCLC